MKKILLLVLVTLTIGANAQYQWDYGIKLGASNYLGDIGGKEKTRRDFVPDMHLKVTNFCAGLWGRYKFSKRLSAAVNLDYIPLDDRDALTTNMPRRARNMNFKNSLIELGARAELTIWYDNDVGGRGYYNPDFKMYLFGGLAGFYSNPKGQIVVDADGVPTNDETWYALRKWNTEGQEKSYSTIGLAIPAGIGLYFTFDKTWRIGWEFSWRTTFTDYIDDISTTYAIPNSSDPNALAFVNQSNQPLIDELNALEENKDSDFYPLHINNFRYVPGFETKRGDPTHNDSYLTTQLTIGKVIRGRSKFYKSKYSWLKNRASIRRSRAKF